MNIKWTIQKRIKAEQKKLSDKLSNEYRDKNTYKKKIVKTFSFSKYLKYLNYFFDVFVKCIFLFFFCFKTTKYPSSWAQ